jgi:hypothetical protein
MITKALGKELVRRYEADYFCADAAKPIGASAKIIFRYIILKKAGSLVGTLTIFMSIVRLHVINDQAA